LFSTFSSSTASAEWSCRITLPAVSLADAGLAGMTRSTYRSPNSVVGTIRAVTFAGISGTMAGWMASSIFAPVPSAEICRTSPT